MKNVILLVTTALLLHVATTSGALPDPTAAVFDDYFNIQTALAQDSLENLAVNARAIAEIVRHNTTGPFRQELANEAEALAVANDLPKARQIFKAMSGYLIQIFRAGSGPGGTIREMHDSVYNVNWLQRGDTLQDPYLGKAGLKIVPFVH